MNLKTVRVLANTFLTNNSMQFKVSNLELQINAQHFLASWHLPWLRPMVEEWTDYFCIYFDGMSACDNQLQGWVMMQWHLLQWSLTKRRIPKRLQLLPLTFMRISAIRLMRCMGILKSRKLSLTPMLQEDDTNVTQLLPCPKLEVAVMVGSPYMLTEESAAQAWCAVIGHTAFKRIRFDANKVRNIQ